MPVEEFIQSIEPSIQKLEKQKADDIRIQIHEVLKHSKPSKSNLSKREFQAINDLQSILDTDTYARLKKNPIPSVERKLAAKLLSLKP